jgi:hypothetical protein
MQFPCHVHKYFAEWKLRHPTRTGAGTRGIRTKDLALHFGAAGPPRPHAVIPLAASHFYNSLRSITFEFISFSLAQVK